MEAAILVLIVAALAFAFGLLSVCFGADSRDLIGDDHRQAI